MASLYDVLFLMQFIIVILILLFKLYNVMNLGSIYGIAGIILTTVGYLIAYIIGLVVLMLSPENILYGTLLNLETWAILLILGFVVMEILTLFKTVTQYQNNYSSNNR